MRVVLVKHGETIENVSHIHQGWGIEGKLTEKGIEQSQRLAERLKEWRFDACYVSPLQRCQLTAAFILYYHPETRIILSNAIRAKRSGVYEGKDRTAYLEAVERLRVPIYKFRAPGGGESTEDQQRRIVGFFETLSRKDYDTVLAVTHGGVMTVYQLYLLGRPFEDYDIIQPKAGAITVLKSDDSNRRFKIETMNLTDHLLS
ncbi:histidine phosphatase family protein [Candidatus Woesearchaeota archaeon]|nr:histidine phosphatase family protein [Candidatus Woesearchaeota archaeon]